MFGYSSYPGAIIKCPDLPVLLQSPANAKVCPKTQWNSNTVCVRVETLVIYALMSRIV